MSDEIKTQSVHVEINLVDEDYHRETIADVKLAVPAGLDAASLATYASLVTETATRQLRELILAGLKHRGHDRAIDALIEAIEKHGPITRVDVVELDRRTDNEQPDRPGSESDLAVGAAVSDD